MAWLRSQDGELLLNASTVEYSTDKNKVHRFYADGVKIGDFPTQEAALAELDRIYIWICNSALGVFKVASDEHFSD